MFLARLTRLFFLYSGYDFTKVVQWWAEKSDLIIVLFDAHKLDISDELKGAIDALKGHEDKIRCILNKADQIDRQQLMRVYGALLWSLGKTMTSPEVARVYVGSFWDEPLQNLDNADLFEKEEKDLMRDLAILPRQSAVRKINELVKRIRKVKTLAYIIGHLKSQMPTVMGKEKKQKKLINDLPNVFRTILKKYNLAAGDFPDLTTFSQKLTESKFAEFHSLSQKQIDALDHALNVEIPKLMEVWFTSPMGLLILFEIIAHVVFFRSFRNSRVKRTLRKLFVQRWRMDRMVSQQFRFLPKPRDLAKKTMPLTTTPLDTLRMTKIITGTYM